MKTKSPRAKPNSQKPNKLLQAIHAAPRKRKPTWLDRLDPADLEEIMGVRAAYQAGEVKHMSVAEILEVCRQNAKCPVGYSQFRKFLLGLE